MELFNKKTKKRAIGEENHSDGGLLELRKQIAELELKLNNSAKEKEILQTSLQDERNRHDKTKINLKKRSKQCKRLTNQRERNKSIISDLTKENKNLLTRIRNSRARAKKYKERAESKNNKI